MKLSLRASISPLFTGGKRSLSEAISTKPKLPFSNGAVSSSKSHAGFKYFINSYSTRRISHLGVLDKFSNKMTSGEILLSCRRYGVHGIQNLKRSLHSSSDEEDEFAELGLPAPEVHGIQNLKRSQHSSSDEEDEFAELGLPAPEVHAIQNLKRSLRSSANEDDEFTESGLQIFTEKPEKSSNGDSSRSAIGMVRHAKNKSIKDLPKTKNTLFSPLFSDVGKHNGGSTTASPQDAHNDKQSRTIRIENIPPTINVNQLREAVSVFGEISSAYMKDSNGSYQSCHVEYKSVESKQRAIAAQGITLKSFHLPVSNFHLQENTTIRVSNISKHTAEASIHSICMECGPLEGLKRTKDGAVDALFNVKDTSTRQKIINILNDKVVDGCQWSAKLASGDNSTATTNTDDLAQFSSQFTSVLSDMKKRFETKKIYLQDLQLLHDTIVHLQDGEAAC